MLSICACFFQYHKKSDDYWMSAMILGIDNVTEKTENKAIPYDN